MADKEKKAAAAEETVRIPGPILKSAKEIGPMLFSALPFVKSPQLQRSPRVKTKTLWFPSPPFTAPSEPLPSSAAVGRFTLKEVPGFALSHRGLNAAGSGNVTAPQANPQSPSPASAINRLAYPIVNTASILPHPSRDKPHGPPPPVKDDLRKRIQAKKLSHIPPADARAKQTLSFRLRYLRAFGKLIRVFNHTGD